ncbi:hypothetical protein BCR33DRAFT_779781 [Rhizoclosmatium globosum]|uniref:L domain-like protein n=1 Tax=Rhizoclosmatium globosum TaxID=329046 RepID=A0A1Y2D038_9FUNG|nr:hypothetical protein BCR33DRAFT_779781 [Rhizoclosmatium globosum]|eukprot:ORY52496.1 hypothetical protein BCR33DRAFT_779781 [Rhizoclosmatium globosum]
MHEINRDGTKGLDVAGFSVGVVRARCVAVRGRQPHRRLPPSLGAALPRLTKLDLANNKLSDWAAVEPLKGLASLKHLVLEANNVAKNKDYRTRLFEWLPALVSLDGTNKDGEEVDDEDDEEDEDDEDEEDEYEDEEEDGDEVRMMMRTMKGGDDGDEDDDDGEEEGEEESTDNKRKRSSDDLDDDDDDVDAPHQKSNSHVSPYVDISSSATILLRFCLLSWRRIHRNVSIYPSIYL